MVGTIASLLSAGLVALVLMRRMRRRGQAVAACAGAGAICLAGALTWKLIADGDAGAQVACAVCVGATLVALRTRGVRAGALLAFALATACATLIVVQPVAALLAAPLTPLWLRSRRRTPDDALALVALLFLLGSLPFVLALVAWEGLTRRGLPALSLLSAAAVYLFPPCAVALGAGLAARLYVPSLGRRRVLARAWRYRARRVPA